MKEISPGPLLLIAVATATSVALAFIPLKGPSDGDFPLFVIPWMTQIHTLGWHSIAGSFSEYSPVHIYLLNLAAQLPTDTVTAVKLLNVPFIVSLACATEKLGGRTAAIVLICLPSVLINAFAIGQCDVIYTSFLVWFVVFAERNKPQAAALMFGLAFSFKAQAMFLSPVLLYLLLSRRMKLWHATVIPLTYLFLMIPAAIAGRPWKQLVLVYFHQTNLVHLLSLSSPNPWWVFQSIVDYQTGLVIGLLLGAACALTIALWAWRSRPPVLLVASLSALVLPFVLPKMTERYFFVADVMTFALAFRVPRMWPVAALVQVASVLCVLPYLTYTPTTIYGVVPMTIAVGIMIALALGEYPLHRPVLFRGDRTRTTNAI